MSFCLLLTLILSALNLATTQFIVGVDYTLSQIKLVKLSSLTDNNVVSEVHFIYPYYSGFRKEPADHPYISQIFTVPLGY